MEVGVIDVRGFLTGLNGFKMVEKKLRWHTLIGETVRIDKQYVKKIVMGSSLENISSHYIDYQGVFS